MITVSSLFDISHTLAADMLMGCAHPWDALAIIGETVMRIGNGLDSERFCRMAEDVWVSKSAYLSPAAHIHGPCIICEGAQVRPGAYIRGNVLVGRESVVGNSTELKNCILFDNVQAPHYNYIGDSILGYRAHMGAGAVTSNIKGDRSNIVVHADREYETGLRKFGAMVGDFAEIGCGSVLNPGVIIGRNTQVYPLSCVRGAIPENSILKGERGICKKV